ncbi:MAG: hypothetical protein ACRDYV_02650, partial [Acidimicrobiia bacterium]
ARFYGSTGNIRLSRPIVGMARTLSGQGYWLVAGDGGVFTFNAPFRGSAAGAHPSTPAVALAATPDGQGYWVVVRGGDVFDFGTANDFGSP